MMKKIIFILVVIAFAPAFAFADLMEDAKSSFEPIPEKLVFKKGNPGNPDKLELGKMLFFETRLSKSNVFSCNSCHNLAGGGVDNNSFSIGHQWKAGGRNAPTVWNASLHVSQFWDGRAEDVEAQAQGPILAGVEMAASKELVMARLNSIPEYVERFKKAFPEQKHPMKYGNIANAIGVFERTLLTPSMFDKFLKGNKSAITAKEKKGLRVFMDKGCDTCHNGVAVGGGLYQKFGVENMPKNLTDKGRFEVTKNKEDMYVFKVPSLRNITLTYPYFNDGSEWELGEAVRIMGWTQLGVKLTDGEVSDIVSFLASLTGDLPEITLPKLPASSKSTPRPDNN